MANVRRLCELGMPPELAKEVAAQIEAATGAVTSVNGATGVVVLAAEDIGFTPAGNLAATDVQAALEELDTEKAAV